jgi:hypothetical protein
VLPCVALLLLPGWIFHAAQTDDICYLADCPMTTDDALYNIILPYTLLLLGRSAFCASMWHVYYHLTGTLVVYSPYATLRVTTYGLRMLFLCSRLLLMYSSVLIAERFVITVSLLWIA